MLAPCVAVVGPAGSGKTTLLHLLDQALQSHPAQPLTYVVKGNPDGSGRYLLYSPDLRELLKPAEKGQWAKTTPAQIAEWVRNARTHLDLVLLDFGGQHADVNAEMLRECTHYIVLARRFTDPLEEEKEGMNSWRAVCEQSGLAPVALVESLWQQGEPSFEDDARGWLNARLRGDASTVGDQTNSAVVSAIVARLLSLPSPARKPSYVNLHLDRQWDPSDLETLGGRLSMIQDQARSAGYVALGGRAPIWAVLAAMHRALDANPDAGIDIFDPKTPMGLVRIPRLGAGTGSGFPDGVLDVGWTTERPEGFAPVPKDYAQLALEKLTEDKFLPAEATLHLADAPLPEPPRAPKSKVVVFGGAPIWLYAAYSRWLRSLDGVTMIASWDAKLKTEIAVHSVPAARGSAAASRQ